MRRLHTGFFIAALIAACTKSESSHPNDPKQVAANDLAKESATPSQPIAKSDVSENPNATVWGILDEGHRPSGGVNDVHVIRRVEQMPANSSLVSRARRRGLSIVNVAWEDTGRHVGSSVGPNISDLTLQVRYRDERGEDRAALMPVFRLPNFHDRTADIRADKFFVRTGNERSGTLTSVPLKSVLGDIRRFSAKPANIRGSGRLSASRDSHYLVSAQAVFLPIGARGKAEFNPVLFNYQSTPSSPAVLSMVVTREGTSMAVIENRPGEMSAAAGRGQELYFNSKGMRAAFTAERRSDVEARIERKGGAKTAEDRAQLARGADVIFLVQVPLKHRQTWRGGFGGGPPPAEGAPGAGSAPAAKPKSAPAPDFMDEEQSDVERAVLGHGPLLGPFDEGRGHLLERDPRFPVRITVQFYKATSNGVASDKDLDAIAKTIGDVYEHADFVGSLVMPDGDPNRPTAWTRVPSHWFSW